MNFGNCQPEVVTDIISGTTDVGIDVYANFGNSGLKLPFNQLVNQSSAGQLDVMFYRPVV